MACVRQISHLTLRPCECAGCPPSANIDRLAPNRCTSTTRGPSWMDRSLHRVQQNPDATRGTGTASVSLPKPRRIPSTGERASERVSEVSKRHDCPSASVGNNFRFDRPGFPDPQQLHTHDQVDSTTRLCQGVGGQKKNSIHPTTTIHTLSISSESVLDSLRSTLHLCIF